jgi:hypothetical protein
MTHMTHLLNEGLDDLRGLGRQKRHVRHASWK